MSKEFDIDTPPDMELLAGTPDGEPETPEVKEEAAPDAEEAPEQEESAEPEQEEEEEAPQPKRDQAIPRARFDEVNAKLHATREEVEQLRAALEAKQAPAAEKSPIDVDALEEAYFDAFLEGDKDKAREIRAQINAEIYRKAEEASAEVVTKRLTEREVQSSFAAAVAKTVEAYPFLDSNNPESSPEAIAEVVEWRDFYISKGESPAVALERAAHKVAPLYSVAHKELKEPVTDTRKQKAMETAAKASAAQPPRVDAGVGNRAIPSGDSIIGDQDKWEKASDAERLRFLQ